MRSLIGRLVPAMIRHLEGYAEIAGEDAREATSFVAKRLLAMLAAGACGFVALLMFCIWLLAIAWDTAARTWTAAGLMLAFGAGAVFLAWPALRGERGPHAVFFPRVRNELSRDRELIEKAFNGRGREGNGREQRAD